MKEPRGHKIASILEATVEPAAYEQIAERCPTVPPKSLRPMLHHLVKTRRMNRLGGDVWVRA